MSAKKRKAAKPFPYFTIGVRFVNGRDLTKVYTYRVRHTRKVIHGDLLVADSPVGPAIVAVVRIDKVRTDTQMFNYKYIDKKVGAL